nr:unnamed protein product [Callosobruchus analis]
MENRSSYFAKLKSDYPDVAERYEKKIKIIGGLDPLFLDRSALSYSADNFPAVSNVDIISYLVFSTSYYTKQQMKAYKSLEAFKYFEAGFVSDCGVLFIGTAYALVLAKCEPLRNMTFTRVVSDPSSDTAKNVEPCTKEEMINCIRELKDSETSVLMYVMEPFISEMEQPSELLENPYRHLHNVQYEILDWGQLLQLTEQYVKIEISQTECERIDYATRQQAASEEWYNQRTASKFKQMQMQMALTETFYCDFVIWYPKGLFVERIHFNEDFWLCHSAKALEFHKKVIMPELLGCLYTRSTPSIPLWCQCQGPDDGRPMLQCCQETCVTKWYHLECVGLQNVPDNVWICNNCQTSIE